MIWWWFRVTLWWFGWLRVVRWWFRVAWWWSGWFDGSLGFFGGLVVV